jgi:uncharacterized phage protein gp47/JayE
MAIIIKTRAELISDLATAIKGRDQAIATGYGPVKDILIDPVSQVARELYLQVKHVFDVQFLKNAELMSFEELDLLGGSLGIKRKGPIQAVGSVFFFTSNRPTADVVIPSGFPVTTTAIAGSVAFQSFVTTRATTFFFVSADAFFNPAAGVFEFEVPIRALIPGSSGNAAAGTIRTIQRQQPGVAGCVNKSGTIGGRDTETNTEYARRIRLVLLGTDRGTVNGLRRFGLEDERVIDALVVQSGDPLLTRTESVAGAIDVYILGEEPTIDQQPDTYTSLDIFFRHEPLVFPTPVSQVTGAIVGTLTEGHQFFIDRDVILDGSPRARNLLRWNRGWTATIDDPVDLPAFGESLTIEYTYDLLMLDLQTSIDKPENDVLADVLFRRSTQVDLKLAATIKAAGDVVIADLTDQIRSSLTEFVNTRGLGESVTPSDIDVTIRAVPGVDFVFLPFSVFARVGESGSGTVTIAKNEFAQLSDTNITLEISV